VTIRRRGKLIHMLFDVGVIGKGIDGVLEIAGGVLLVALTRSQITGIVATLTQHELSEDPRDLLARALVQASAHLSASTQLFGAVYLLVHGAIKVGLVAALLRRKPWAYPWAIVAFLLFLLYQLYRYTHTKSLGLLALSALDVFVILITWLEYRRLRVSHAFS
jgi:uncharacterized membrane protein